MEDQKPGKRINLYEITGVLGKAYRQAASLGKGMKGFRACGLMPCNRDIFGEQDLIQNLPYSLLHTPPRLYHLPIHALGNHRDPSHIAFGIGVFLLVACFCICLQSCCEECCSKEDHSETDAAAASAPEYEAVGPRSDELSQPSGTHYPAQPSYTPTGPLVHDPTDNPPPSYSEVVASAEQAVVPSAPVYSDVEPRFELKGMTFPSDSASVYTSDKLNFL
ncbi:uncharacterized protein LOC121902300 [Thunnus maccoyii]|uniref:uncharacterized protein LOC121902300 n=1 Tax=Thunnus maccoyii TaxID=8240 RepID=UPI001C4C822A|nr:uncharacterized protein LOC121902300 [Thunnus maccoyii]